MIEVIKFNNTFIIPGNKMLFSNIKRTKINIDDLGNRGFYFDDEMTGYIHVSSYLKRGYSSKSSITYQFLHSKEYNIFLREEKLKRILHNK